MRKLTTLLAVMIVLAAALAGSTARAKGGPVQDVFIFCPDEIDPGAMAAFRVVVREALDLSTSRPVRGARVEVALKSGKDSYRLLKARTDESGTVAESIKVPELPAGDDYQLVVRVSSELGDEEKTHPVKITPRYRVLLSSDKPLYQPGQLIHMRAVALRMADLNPVAHAKVTLEVEDPQGNKVFKRAGKTDRYGIFAADFQLADEIRLGEYVVRAVVADTEAEKSLTVKRYVLPKFKVVLDTDKTYYRPGEKVSGTVSANYFFGKPVDNGKVTITAQAFDFEFHTVAEVTGKTDADGNFEFELTLPDYFAGQPLEKGDAFVKLDASVIDNAKHTETATVERKVAGADLRLDLVPEAGRIIPGVENRIYAVVATPDSRPVKATVRIKVGDRTFTAESDDTGVAEVSFVPEDGDFSLSGNQYDQWGNLRNSYLISLTGEAEDSQGRTVSVSRDFSTESLRDSVLLRTDRVVYTAGDDMVVEALSTYSTGTVYLDIIRGRRTVLTRAMDLNNGKARLRLPIAQDLFGTLELHAYVILPSGEITRDTRVVYVEQGDDLTIDVSLDRDTYRPGESATLVFKVKDRKGSGRAAALGISVVDESVFAIQDMQPGLLKVYFTLEKELLKPRYEVHFTPGGQSMESMIRGREEAEARRDKVMRVLTAGVESPTAMAWQENPAEKRLEEEKGRLQGFTYSFMQYIKNHDFIYRDKGQWKYLPDVVERMIDDKAIDKDQAYDAFGNPYDPAMLTVLDPSLELRAVADAVASYRLNMIYAALDRYMEGGESWIDRMFEGGKISELPSDVLEVLVDKDLLEKGAHKDPWGNEFLVAKRLKSANNPYNARYNNYDLRSAGADGRFHTADDVTDPWAYNRVPYMYQMMYDLEEEGMVRRFRGMLGGGMMKAEMAMPMAAAPEEMMAMDGAVAFESNEKPKAGAKPVRVREYFPETLFWDPSLITDRWGNAELTIPLADSITTWRLTALGHSAEGYLGSATSGIRVFQDFFTDIDFPVQLTQGDEVEIPVAVYNYLPGPQRVVLEVREHDGFELMSDPVQKVRLNSGQVDVRYFRVKATKVGKQTLTVYAIGDKLSDAIKRSVEVVPDGLRVETVKNGRITGDLSEEIVIPGYAIDDASRIMVKIYPGVFAQVLEGLDGIFRMPSGCFEQTTSTTYPNVMVLSYMKKTGTISPEIQMKAEGFINLGYQRLLSFEVPGGGFEWFGNTPAHKVLTAYGLMEFSDMSKVYPIDEAVITRTQQWLADQQERDGSWKPVEHWLETLSGEDFSKSVELNTAYIAWALAESGYKGDALKKGIGYLKDHLKDIDDAYTLALAVNALIAADPEDPEGIDLLRRLDGLKVEDAKTGTAHWEPKGQTAVHGTGNTAMVETTSLILYAMIKAGRHPATANKGLAWLAQQKDGFGTFQSTQATILAFKAMLAAEEGKAPDVRGEIMVSMGGRTETVKITPEDSDVLRLIDFKDQTRAAANTVKIEAPPDMGLMYQVVGIHYVPWDRVRKDKGAQVLSLDLAYDRKRLAADDVLTATVTAEYLGRGATDMVILDLGIPPGFSLQTQELDKLKRDKVIEKYTATGRQITVYVRRMESGKPLKFSYRLKAKFPVKAQAPKSAAYEYYNPDNRAETRPVQIEVTK